MTLRIHEIDGSGDGIESLDKGSTARLGWDLFGSDVVADMQTAVWAEVPSTYTSGTRTLIFRSLERRQQGPAHWQWFANYVDPERENEERQEGDSLTWDYDTTAGTLHVYASKETIDTTAGAPDFEGAIEVNGQDVKGTTVHVGGLVKLTAHFKSSSVIDPLARAAALAPLVAKVNNGVFFGRPRGTMLYLGSRGGSSFGSGTKEDLDFLYSPDAAGIVIGALAGIDKPGHAYLWIRFEPADDAGANRTVQRPKWVYVERIYEEADLTALGIGGGP